MHRAFLILALAVGACAPAQAKKKKEAAPSASACATCHEAQTPGIVNQWRHSRHGETGVDCADCHGAKEGEPDAFEHNGAWVSVIVTPKDCGTCHEKEAEEVSNSYHATAGEILESKDAYLANAAGGHPAAVAGCQYCHGARIEVDPDAPNRIGDVDWPNTGIGRLNPDGSKGSCTACHARHEFSLAQARSPEACSKCHLGPDHPQKEIYDESKHGNAFYTHRDEMNLDSRSWVVGVDYWAAPTCATCHMSATRTQPVTHDVGQRISWTLRPPISKHKDDWERKRANMKEVCTACHASSWVDGFYTQYDGVVNLYNEKFAKPATEIMKMIRSKGLLENKAAFSNDIEWTYWEIWHHEGRRARHGAAMMGPDYTWWHGIYEVAKHFYFEFIPAARAYGDPEVNAYIDELLEDPMHRWMSQDTDAIKEAIRNGELGKIYEEMYRP